MRPKTPTNASEVERELPVTRQPQLPELPVALELVVVPVSTVVVCAPFAPAAPDEEAPLPHPTSRNSAGST